MARNPAPPGSQDGFINSETDFIAPTLFAQLVGRLVVAKVVEHPSPDGQMGIRGRFQLFVTQMTARKAMTTAMDEKAALTCRFVSFADAG